MTDVRKWFCIRCFKDHDIIDGVVQCDAPRLKSMTVEQTLQAMQWAMDNPISTTTLSDEH